MYELSGCMSDRELVNSTLESVIVISILHTHEKVVSQKTGEKKTYKNGVSSLVA